MRNTLSDFSLFIVKVLRNIRVNFEIDTIEPDASNTTKRATSSILVI